MSTDEAERNGLIPNWLRFKVSLQFPLIRWIHQFDSDTELHSAILDRIRKALYEYVGILLTIERR